MKIADGGRQPAERRTQNSGEQRAAARLPSFIRRSGFSHINLRLVHRIAAMKRQAPARSAKHTIALLTDDLFCLAQRRVGTFFL